MRMLVTSLCLLAGCTLLPEKAVDPALRLHGHNDYLQAVPLVHALELGLGSIEVDIYLEEGELRVGHERWQLRPGRTLQSLYLEPLRAAVRHRGHLRSDGNPLVLLIEIKADGAAVYRELRDVLNNYREMLTRFRQGSVDPRAVTVLLSGNRPARLVAADRDRLCALDGRMQDLEASPSPPRDLVPWVSGPWKRISDWTGSDELMSDELQRVKALVAKAHAQGRAIRFWGAPDRKESWGAFFDLGLDYIGSDQPKKAAKWLRAFRASEGR